MRKTIKFASKSTQKLLRRLVGGWSLERKSLLLFGLALVLPIGLAFWFVLEVVADRLVLQTTRQKARDYAKIVIGWTHAEAHLGSASFDMSPVMALMREDLIDNPSYHHRFLMLDQQTQYIDLNQSEVPTTPEERELLIELRDDFRAYLNERLEAEAAVVAERTGATESESLDLEAAENSEQLFNPALPPGQPTIGAVPTEATESADRERRDLFKDDGPIFLTAREQEGLGEGDEQQGWYAYYHVVAFEDRCLDCHKRFEASTADPMPFRVLKVLTPYEDKQVTSTWTLTVMISIGMVTVSVTLLVVHWVLRRIVLTPLTHLKGVADEISRGNTDLRANIDTDDEFNELADAFNRMLRHLTESQQKLQGVNKELDVRVDQLAQANLSLFEGNRLKNDFLANMSHELRTPLNSIIGFSDVLVDIPSLSDKQRRYAGNIRKSGKLLLEMINDILDLAKVEAGKMTVVPTSFDVEMLVSAQCDMLRSLVDERNMDLNLEVEPEIEDVFQDQTKFQQILTNLLSNAIKFTPDGGLITVTVCDATDGFFCVSVADTGVGIPEADFEVIFEKFRQSNEVLQNGGLTREFAGTGLGLSIVKELCKLLGGEVRLTSQLGTGSKFEVILPKHYEQAFASELTTS